MLYNDITLESIRISDLVVKGYTEKEQSAKRSAVMDRRPVRPEKDLGKYLSEYYKF